jgi:3D (Asp-Asp-Asp) domain-containing protein
MATIFRFTITATAACLLSSCATTPVQTAKTGSAGKAGRIQKVRTTAYTAAAAEGGPRNAIGKRLCGGPVKSAASDWSRFPLGTRFRIVGTNEEYVIDDYGGALIGTDTIDLYKTSRAAMNRWGVRHVDIQITQWGSEAESLKVLRPRQRARIVRRMVASLEEKVQPRTASARTGAPRSL